jgi:hypothetical protein
MTAALMIEGALLGTLVSQVKIDLLQSTIFQGFTVLMLFILMFYPLRTAGRLAGEIPVYRERAVAWDAREAEIKAMKADGQTDLVVRFLSKERLQDLGDHEGFRLNRCAAALYGVNTIVAVPMHDK